MGMKVRFLGHSCVEIMGQHHILIDPDFSDAPQPGVEYICITHAHMGHIGRVAEVTTGTVLAAADVCDVAARLGVPRDRLKPVQSGEKIANIRVFPGYSQTNGLLYSILSILFKRHWPEPSGTPLSFLVEDEAALLHIGVAHEMPLDIKPDILCLPYRKVPFRQDLYKETLQKMANRLSPGYVLPVHFDLNHSKADPMEIKPGLKARVLDPRDWHVFRNKQKVDYWYGPEIKEVTTAG
jgi:L-ascorbate metabolism protein UlaG (beta-lactamase superfamily)